MPRLNFPRNRKELAIAIAANVAVLLFFVAIIILAIVESLHGIH